MAEGVFSINYSKYFIGENRKERQTRSTTNGEMAKIDKRHMSHGMTEWVCDIYVIFREAELLTIYWNIISSIKVYTIVD